MLAYDENGNLVEDGGQQYNPDPLATNNPQYGDPFNRFMNSPHMAGAQQALLNMAALRRGIVPQTTPFSAMYDVRKQNQLLMDRKFAYLEEKRRWQEGQALRDAQLQAANFKNKTNAEAVPNPYQNLPQNIQEWELSGAKARGIPFEKFLEAKNPFHVQPTQPTSVMQNFGAWRQLNPPRSGETQEQYQTRQQEAFNNLARAGTMVDYGGGGKLYVNPLTGAPVEVVSAPQATALEANQAGAETRAKETAKSDIDRKNQQRTNAMAYDAYQEAMNGISNAFAETDTGPVAGKMPAVTAAQQTAEGAVAAAAPVLKQLFRSSGEGVFTDKDQALLMDMLPKRTDHPEVVQYKLATIDKIVAAKLGTAGQPAAEDKGEDLGSTDGY